MVANRPWAICRCSLSCGVCYLLPQILQCRGDEMIIDSKPFNERCLKFIGSYYWSRGAHNNKFLHNVHMVRAWTCIRNGRMVCTSCSCGLQVFPKVGDFALANRVFYARYSHLCYLFSYLDIYPSTCFWCNIILNMIRLAKISSEGGGKSNITQVRL